MEMKDKIKELRAARHMTLEDVAKMVGVGKSTVRKWENGDIANMRRDKIYKLATALGTTPGYLMGWDDDNSSSPSAEDKELMEYLDVLKTRPECRMLFKLTKDASKADVEKAVAIVEALRRTEEQ